MRPENAKVRLTELIQAGEQIEIHRWTERVEEWPTREESVRHLAKLKDSGQMTAWTTEVSNFLDAAIDPSSTTAGDLAVAFRDCPAGVDRLEDCLSKLRGLLQSLERGELRLRHTEREGGRKTNSADPRTVFVVHGRNLAARDATFSFLRALGLTPMEWSQAAALVPSSQPTVWEILEAAFEHAQAIVVLLTGDDEARLRSDYAGAKPESLTPQPRQNVLLEAGMALQRDRNRTLLVQLGSVREVSDVQGFHFLRMSNSPKLRNDFAKRLERANCKVEMAGTDWLEAPAGGDFDAAVLPSVPVPRASDYEADARKALDKKNGVLVLEERIGPYYPGEYCAACYSVSKTEDLISLVHRPPSHDNLGKWRCPKCKEHFGPSEPVDMSGFGPIIRR